MSGRLNLLKDLKTTLGFGVGLSSDEWLSMLSRFVLIEWIPRNVSVLGSLIGFVAGSLTASMALAAAVVAAFWAATPRNLKHVQ